MTGLVTGAAGFVGSHLVEELLTRGDAVRALVRRPEQADSLRQRGVEVVVGDMRDPALWPGLLAGVDAVFHCASATEVDGSAREASAANILGLRLLLEASANSSRPHMVLPTGLSVLGLKNFDPATEDLPRRHSADADIETKVQAEELVLDFHERHGLPITILRPAFIYGPGDARNLPKLLGAIRSGEFRFVGRRDNIVPMVHVSDMAQAMISAAQNPSAA